MVVATTLSSAIVMCKTILEVLQNLDCDNEECSALERLVLSIQHLLCQMKKSSYDGKLRTNCRPLIGECLAVSA